MPLTAVSNSTIAARSTEGAKKGTKPSARQSETQNEHEKDDKVKVKGDDVDHEEGGDSKGHNYNIIKNSNDERQDDKKKKLAKDTPPKEERDVVFVHVGKTGGTTLNTVLECNCLWFSNRKVKAECLQNLAKQSTKSKISNMTKLQLHGNPRPGFDEFNERDNVSYLVTARNPIDRVISAFNYEHPLNNGGDVNHKRFKMFYGTCFPTIQDMADVLTARPPKGSNRWKKQQQEEERKQKEVRERRRLRRRRLQQLNETEGGRRDSNDHQRLTEKEEEQCSRLGRGKLHGQSMSSQSAYHIYANYYHYGRLTYLAYPQREIWTIRTEHLWDDMNHLE